MITRSFADLLESLGPAYKTTGLSADRAYDSRANVEDFADAGITLVNRKNNRNTKKAKGNRLQDYCQVHRNRLHLYKNRIDCEVTNAILKSISALKIRRPREYDETG